MYAWAANDVQRLSVGGIQTMTCSGGEEKPGPGSETDGKRAAESVERPDPPPERIVLVLLLLLIRAFGALGGGLKNLEAAAGPA